MEVCLSDRESHKSMVHGALGTHRGHEVLVTRDWLGVGVQGHLLCYSEIRFHSLIKRLKILWTRTNG